MSSLSDWNVDVSTLLGSGFAASVLLLALVERLRRTFVTRQELTGLEGKFHALESLYLQVRDAADANRDQLVEIRTEQRHHWERTAEHVIKPLGRMAERLDEIGGAQASQASTLEHIGRRLDRVEESLHSAPTPARRKS
ncbi:MAG: hypothetical protein KY464_12185 [Gemmatimonadetes bacterium]|nr:hypothetical protein [Gemmatimonadota bacterium]